MVEFQNGMIPQGAYYMNYGRRPGRNKGNGYSADSACIAMGVLAATIGRSPGTFDMARVS